MQVSEAGLLMAEDGPAVGLENPDGASPIVLVCEHAANRIPAALDRLGLDDEVLDSHVGWDIGALGVARILAATLDATLVHQRFSRLIYDCNRPPGATDAMPAVSEAYEIAANRALDEGARAARIEAIYRPFEAAIARVIAARFAREIKPMLVTIHSFTRVYNGMRRDLDLGILHDADARLAERLLAGAARLADCKVGRNEPYGPRDGVTHTLRLHGIAHGIENVMIEIANDKIAQEADQKLWAERLAELLTNALANRQEHGETLFARHSR